MVTICGPCPGVGSGPKTSGKFVKLNQRTKPHAAYLPAMDVLVENLARMTWKSKLDLRSGFWQVLLTPRAAELTIFVLIGDVCANADVVKKCP